MRKPVYVFQTGAEEICALIDQCFQLVYAEATRQFFNNKISEGTHSHNMTSISSSSATRSGECWGPLVLYLPHDERDQENLDYKWDLKKKKKKNIF